jgi:hypothetical protein
VSTGRGVRDCMAYNVHGEVSSITLHTALPLELRMTEAMVATHDEHGVSYLVFAHTATQDYHARFP